MNRRKFLIRIPGLLGLPLIIQQIGCDSESSLYGSGNGSDDSDNTSFKITSSSSGSHTHTVKISYSDVENPPGSSKTLTSSSTGHTHQITLSPSDYQALKDGNTISKTSTVESGHSHSFSIKVPVQTRSKKSRFPFYSSLIHGVYQIKPEFRDGIYPVEHFYSSRDSTR